MKSIKMLLILLHLILNAIIVRAGNSSLAFVIDDSDSMGEEIDQVRRGARGIMDIILNYKSSQVKDIVLVTFNDPENLNKLRITTNDPEKLQQQLDIIHPYNENNYDYEEYSLSGIKLALEHSKPNSYIFVFTDASAKDLYEAAGIKTICQRTQTQINFILTDYCIEKKDRKCLIYHEIALACSGQVFRVYKGEIDKVIEYIKETIQGEKNILATRTLPAYDSTEVEFEVNDDIEYVLISGAGKGISITASKGPSNDYTSVLSTYNTKVLRLNNPTPGTYGVVVYGTDVVQLQIFGRTDFTFEHGFSKHVPKTILNTSKQPVAGNNYLAISITNDHKVENIENALIWDMDDTSLYILTLKKVGDLYVTEPFEAPEEQFKISVTGIQNGKRIHRFAKTPIEPQSIDSYNAEDHAPVTSIVEGSHLNIHYNATLQLTCIVFAYPEPIITWRDHGKKLLQSQSFILEQPYKYISYLLIDNVKNSTEYTCDASNDVSRNSTSVTVNVDSPFTIPISAEDYINFPFGLIKAGIKCNITSEYRMRIDWFRKVNGSNIQLHTSDQYTISLNGSELNFKTISLASAGEYTCKAVLIDDPSQYKEFTTNVTVHIRDEVPVTSIIQGSEVHVPYNGTLNLTCAVYAYPPPNITWLNDNKIFMGLNYTRLPVDQPYNSTSSILIENIKNATTFTCEAYNNVSNNRSTITIKVDSPFIPLTFPEEYSTITYNTEAAMECNVKSASRMRIDWFRRVDGSNIHLQTTDKYKISSDGTELRFTNATLASAGEYTCKAVLVDDPSQYKEFTTNVTVHIRDEVPVTSIIQGSEVHVPYNGTLNLTCAVYAYPPPNITWFNGNKIFMGLNYTIHQVDYPYNSTSSILVKNIKNATTFTCEAYNSVSNDRSTITIKVDSPFTALIHPAEYSTVTYNTEAAIECNVKASSRMRIDWSRGVNGSNIQLHTSDKYTISSDGTELRFTNATLASAGEYTCKAVLIDDPSQYKEFTANVTVHIRDEAPVTSIIQGSEVHVPYNGTLNLTCAVYAYPPPNITWLNGNKIFMGLNYTSHPVDHPYNSTSSISIENIKNATTFTCEAYNNVSNNRSTITIKVDSPFTALIYPAEYSTLTYNTETAIGCNVKSSSRMRIDWFRRVDGSNIQLHNSDKYTISSDGTELRFTNATLASAGEYTCKAVLIDDPSQYEEFTTDVDIVIEHQAPITNIPEGSHVQVPYNGTLQLTCNAYAFPTPNITWSVGNKQLSSKKIPGATPYEYISNLTINRITTGGVYECSAKNNISVSKSRVNVTVLSPPSVQEGLSGPSNGTKNNNPVQIPTGVSTYPGPYIGSSVSNGIIISGLPLMEQPQDLQKYMVYSNTITSVTTYVSNQQIVTSAQASDVKENYPSAHSTPNNVIVETVPAAQSAVCAEDATKNVQYYDPSNIQKNLAMMIKTNTIFNIPIPQRGPYQPLL